MQSKSTIHGLVSYTITDNDTNNVIGEYKDYNTLSQYVNMYLSHGLKIDQITMSIGLGETIVLPILPVEYTIDFDNKKHIVHYTAIYNHTGTTVQNVSELFLGNTTDDIHSHSYKLIDIPIVSNTSIKINWDIIYQIL